MIRVLLATIAVLSLVLVLFVPVIRSRAEAAAPVPEAPAAHAKKAPTAGAALFVLAFAVGLLPSCAHWKNIVHGVLDAVEIACVLARAELPIEEVALACDISDDAIPVIEKTVDRFKAEREVYAMAKVKAEREKLGATLVCPPAPTMTPIAPSPKKGM